MLFGFLISFFYVNNMFKKLLSIAKPSIMNFQCSCEEWGYSATAIRPGRQKEFLKWSGILEWGDSTNKINELCANKK